LNLSLIDHAAEEAETFLAPLGNRWLHVQGVAEVARQISPAFDEDDRCYLIAAAYLHDIGYAPSLKKTGFHPVDGAYYLRSLGSHRLASLVAYHSESPFEAHLRNLEGALNAFHREQSVIADALTYCDQITGPTGKRVSFNERVTEVFLRYGETHLVSQALRQALPSLSLAIARTEQRLHMHGVEIDISQ
jgi:hypothetical protein